MMRRIIGGVLASAFAIAALGGPALADVEAPAADDPGCVGRIVAYANSISVGGPGKFIEGGQDVEAAIEFRRETRCG